MSGFRWGKRIFKKTLKHIFLKHFHHAGNDKWDLNPHHTDKLREKILPNLRVIMSWGYNRDYIYNLTERDLVGYFLGIIRWNHPDVYESKRQTICKLCVV